MELDTILKKVTDTGPVFESLWLDLTQEPKRRVISEQHRSRPQRRKETIYSVHVAEDKAGISDVFTWETSFKEKSKAKNKTHPPKIQDRAEVGNVNPEQPSLSGMGNEAAQVLGTTLIAFCVFP